MDVKPVGNVQGTLLSTQNAQTLVSSGIPSLDELLGGGLPIGTVVLIEEDLHGAYSKIILKYFLAEGIVSKHSTFVASQDVPPYNIIKELPAVIDSDAEEAVAASNGDGTSDKMKIAFRYQNMQISDETGRRAAPGRHYDLSRTMSLSDIENSHISYWNGQMYEMGASSFTNPAYNDLLRSIKDKIKDGRFFLKDSPSGKSVLRIGVHSLGSPMWLPATATVQGMETSRDLDMFIFCLRALVRSASAVAVITVPTQLYHEVSLERCVHSSDIAMRLQAFSGTELEKNQSLQDYHGFFHLTKLAAINSLASKHPGSVEYAFKLRRKKLVISTLHLPPDIQSSAGDGRKSDIPSLGCGGPNKHLLDF